MTDLMCETDDPFNSRGKTKILNEDDPLPRTNAAFKMAQYEQEDEQSFKEPIKPPPLRTAVKPLVRKAKPAVVSKNNDKENERPKQTVTKSAAPSKPSTNASSNHPKLNELPMEGDMGFDECVSILSQVPSFDSSLLDQLQSSQWQQITQALSALEQWISEDHLTKQLSCACLLRALVDHPGYTSANFQVIRTLLSLTDTMLQVDTFILSSSAARSLTTPLLSKLADRKTSPLAENTLRLIAIASSPRLLIQCIHEALPTIKVVKSLEAALLYVATIIKDFSIQACDLQRVQALANSFLDSSQSLARSAAVKILAAAYGQLGASSRPFFLLPLASTSNSVDIVTTAFNQADEQVNIKGHISIHPQYAGRAPHAVVDRIDVDSLVPRRELTSMLSPSVVVALKEKAWKPRLQSLETITQSIESCHGKVACKDAGLIAAVAGSVGDSNKILHVKALQILLLLVQSTTDGLARHASKIVGPALASLSDSKKQVKDEACALLALWLSKNHLHAATIKGWKQALESTTARSDAFTLIVGWLDTSATNLPSSDVDLSEFVNAGIEALIDKSAETRSKAERFIEHAAARGLAQPITQAMLKLKQAHMMQIKHIVEKCISNARQAQMEAHALAHPSPVRQSKPQVLPQHQPQQVLQSRPRQEDMSHHSIAPSAPTVVMVPTPAPEPASHPFLVHIDLAARSRRLARDAKRVAHADFRPMTQDECTEMTNGLKSLVLPALLAYMMDADGTRANLALDFFIDELSAESTTILAHFHAIVDLLFRWLVWRIERATQTKFMLRCLDLIDLLVYQLGSAGLPLVDTDVATLIPALIERGLGNSLASIRQASASLLLKMRTNGQCTSHRLAAYLNKGLESKNKRVALESCECMATLVSNFPEAAAEIKRSLPAIVNMVSSSDPAARTCALHTLQVEHDRLGDDTFWYSLGDLNSNDKARQIIEERITRKQIDSITVHSQPVIQSIEGSPARVKRTAQIARSPVSTAPTMLALSSSFASLQAMQASMQQSSVCGGWADVDMAFNLTSDGKQRRLSAIDFMYTQLNVVDQHPFIKHRLPLLFRALDRSISLNTEPERDLRSTLLRFIAQYAAHPAIQKDIYVERGFDSQTAIQLGRCALIISAIHPDQSGTLNDACARLYTFLNLDEQLSAICAAQFALLAETNALGMSQQMLFDWGSKISPACLIDVTNAISMLHRLDMSISASNHPQLMQNHGEAVSHCLTCLVECDKVAVLGACRGLDANCNIVLTVQSIIHNNEQKEADALRKMEETRYAPVFPQTNLKGRRSRKLMQSIQPLIQEGQPEMHEESRYDEQQPIEQPRQMAQPMRMNDLFVAPSVQPAVSQPHIAAPPSNFSSLSYSERFRSIQARIKTTSEQQGFSHPVLMPVTQIPQNAQSISTNKAQPALEARLQAMAAIRERMKARSAVTPTESTPQTTSLSRLMTQNQI